MFQRMILGLLVVLLIAVLGLLTWVNSYKVSDPGKAEQIHRDTVSRVQARDSMVQDADKNGYTDLADTLQRETPKEVKAPYQALADWSYPSLGKKETDVLEVYGKKKREINAAVKRFETVLPTLDRALAKPNFIWPSQWQKGAAALVPNFIQMRAIAQNLVGYSEYLAVTGKPARALHYLLGNVELGARVAQNGVLISCMIGIAIDGIALEGAFQILGRSPALTARDYRAALARLDALPLTPQTMLDRMDEEHLFQMTCVEQLAHDTRAVMDNFSYWPARIPGILARDRKVITNIYLLQRPSIEKLRLPSEDGIDIGRVAQESHSILAAILVPSTSRAVAQFRFTLAKIGGLKLLCALQLYRLEKGSYPDSLDPLVPGVLETLPQDYVSADSKFVYKKVGDDFQLSSALSPIMAETLSVKGFSYRPPEPRK